MSIMRLRKVFNRPVRIQVGKRSISLGSPLVAIFWAIVVIFVVGAYSMFSGAPRTRPTGGEERQVTKLVAQVDKYKIARRDFERSLYLVRKNQPTSVDIPQLRYLKTNLLQEMINRHLLLEAVGAEDIKVSKQEIRQEQTRLVDAAISGRFPDQKDLRSYLQRHQLSYEQYRNQLLEDHYGNEEPLREQLLTQKLEDLVRGQVQVTDEQVKEEYTEVKARHILVTPESFLHPTSAEDQPSAEAKANPPQPLTQEQATAKAQQKAQQLLQQIKQGADFAELAKEHSEDPGSAESGGDLDWIRRGQMVKEFEDAVFSLQPEQVSEVVKTDFGFHIIKVEARRSSLPEDFEENKEAYKQQVVSRHQHQAWQQYQHNLEKQANIELFDPELRAYKLLEKANQAEAMGLLTEAVNNDPFNMSARYELAQLYREAGETSTAVKYLRQITESSEGAHSPQIHLGLGELLQEQGLAEEALAEFKSASDWASAPQYGNYFIHMRLKQMFEDLKQPDLVKQEEEWLAAFTEQQEQGLSFPGG